MTKTTNYQLNQWDAADPVQREDFNADNAAIDAALKKLAGQIAAKASTSTVNSLTATVNTKADSSALTAAEARIAVLESGKVDQADLDAAISDLGDAEDRITALESGKADAAALHWVKIMEKTLTGAASAVSLSFSTGGYRRLMLYYETNGPTEIAGSFNGSPQVYYGLNSSDTTFTMAGTAAYAVGGCLELYPAGVDQYVAGKIRADMRYQSGSIVGVSTLEKDILSTELTFPNLTAITLTGVEGNLCSGSHFILYGLKA